MTEEEIIALLLRPPDWMLDVLAEYIAADDDLLAQVVALAAPVVH